MRNSESKSATPASGGRRESICETENSRLKDELALSTLALRVQRAANLPELLESFCDQVFAVPGIDGCLVNLLNESGNALVTAYLRLPEEFAGIQNSYKGFQYHTDKQDVNVRVFNEGKRALVSTSGLGDYAETTNARFARWKMKNLLVLPVTVVRDGAEPEKVGTVMLFSQSVAIDAEMGEHLQKIADFFSAQILFHWNYHQTVQRGKLVDAMYAEIQQFISYISEMNSLTSVDQVYALIGKEFIKRFKFDSVSILLAENNELPIVHTSFSERFRHLAEEWEPFRKATRFSLAIRDGQSGFVFMNNQRFLIDDAKQIEHLPMSEKDRSILRLLKTTRTFLYVPIRLNGAVIGVMWLATLEKPLNPPETDLTLIELLSSFISTSIRNAKLHEDVELKSMQIDSLNQELRGKIVLLDQVARRDRLTGLNNFGNFEEELKRRTSEFSRKGKNGALSVILIDVDHFKRFNDTYGHPAGNIVLQEVSARILKCVRDMDFVARYGGEEFIVLLPQCDKTGAAMIAERIRCKMIDVPFTVNGVDHNISISGGYALFNPPESSRDLICRVDSALYAAKRSGRNCIEAASDNLEQDVG